MEETALDTGSDCVLEEGKAGEMWPMRPENGLGNHNDALRFWYDLLTLAPSLHQTCRAQAPILHSLRPRLCEVYSFGLHIRSNYNAEFSTAYDSFKRKAEIYCCGYQILVDSFACQY